MSNIVEFFLYTSNMHCALARMSVLAVASNKLKIPTINNKLTTSRCPRSVIMTEMRYYRIIYVELYVFLVNLISMIVRSYLL